MHHFLGIEDVKWLSLFDDFGLNEDQKRALIFTREVGAIDNSSYRQLNGVDVLKASLDLRDMRKKEIFAQKGKSRSTYYVVGKNFMANVGYVSAPVQNASAPVETLSAPPQGVSTPVQNASAPVDRFDKVINDKISPLLIEKIENLPVRTTDPLIIEEIIKEICVHDYFRASEISMLLNRSEDYVKRKFLTPMVSHKKLVYLHPDMINHPEQAYRSNKED